MDSKSLEIKHIESNDKSPLRSNGTIELERRITELRKKNTQNEKEISRLKNIIKFDKIARDGQVRKERKNKNELQECKHNNVVLQQFYDESKKDAKNLEIVLQRERASRLLDIHEKEQMIKLKVNAEKINRELIQKYEKLKMNTYNFKCRVSNLETVIVSKNSAIDEIDKETDKNFLEIEALKVENSHLKERLRKKKLEILHHIKMRLKLEKEGAKLKTEVILQSTKGCYRKKSIGSCFEGQTPSVAQEKVSIKKIRNHACPSKAGNGDHHPIPANYPNLKRYVTYRRFYENMAPSYVIKNKNSNYCPSIHETELSLADIALESHLLEH